MNRIFDNHHKYYDLKVVEKILIKIWNFLNFVNFHQIYFVSKFFCIDMHSIYFFLWKFTLIHLSIWFDTSECCQSILSQLHQHQIKILKKIDTFEYNFVTILINLHLRRFFWHPINTHQRIFYLTIKICSYSLLYPLPNNFIQIDHPFLS